jgi:hypothetical protein
MHCVRFVSTYDIDVPLSTENLGAPSGVYNRSYWLGPDVCAAMIPSPGAVTSSFKTVSLRSAVGPLLEKYDVRGAVPSKRRVLAETPAVAPALRQRRRRTTWTSGGCIQLPQP